MALTGRIIASIYRKNQYDLKSTLGVPATEGIGESFPSSLCYFYPVPYPGVTANGVTMASIIELLPTGLNQPSTKFYTDATVAQLQTNGN